MLQRVGHEWFGGVKVGTLWLPALSENTRATARLRGREEEEVDGHGDCRATRNPAGAQTDKCEERWRQRGEREGGAQYFLNSTSFGGLISTFLLPTSFQLVLRTVPPDSMKDLFMARLTSSEPSE